MTIFLSLLHQPYTAFSVILQQSWQMPLWRLYSFLASWISVIKLKSMMPSFPLYANIHQLPIPNSFHPQAPLSRSARSGKASSRKGSTDIDSRTKFKTQVCRYWVNGMECPFADNCNFAHGDEEKRAKDFLPSKYKTRDCHKYQDEGYCPYGNRCQFIHRPRCKARVDRREMLRCLGAESEKFFCFLEQREKNSGHSQRLGVFQCLGGNNAQCSYSISVAEVHRAGETESGQNHVDVRARHNSF